MPLQTNLQLLKFHYREFLRKTAANHRSDGGDPSAYNYYVEYACAEATFDQSLHKMTAAIAAINLAELRALYNARKERAKERLRRAFDAKVSRFNSYLSSSRILEASPSLDHQSVSDGKVSTEKASAIDGRLASPEATSTSGQELQQHFGTDGVLRRTVLYLVGHAARTYMTALNSTRVAGLEVMSAALQRPAGQALITVSNHVAALDDPLVVSVLLPEEKLGQPESLRWTLCASDRCFRYQALVPLFRAAKVLPVVRGGGLTQPGMAAAEARLAAGDWVHIFPEGTRSRDGVTLGAARKGVGRLVASVPQEGPPPLVVPFVHRGMEEVMPRGAVLPAVGRQIDVLVGDPIPVADLLSAAKAERWPADRLHTAVAARVSHGLKDLRRRLDAIRAGGEDPGPQAPPGGGGPSGGGDPSVSSLDQFDPADLALAAELRAARRRREGVSGAWERLKFRMALQHRSWATQGHGAAEAAQVTVVTPAAGAGAGAGGVVPMFEGELGAVGAVAGGVPVGGDGGAVGGLAGAGVAASHQHHHQLLYMGGVSPYVRQLLGLAAHPPQLPGAMATTTAAPVGGRQQGVMMWR